MAVSARGDVIVSFNANGTGQLTIAGDALDKLAGRARGAAGAAKEFDGSFSSMTKSMALGNIAANAAMAVFGNLRQAIGDVVSGGMQWEDVVRGNEASVKAMVAATGGMVDAVTAGRAAIQLTSGDLKLNQEQLEAAAKAALEYSRINGGTVREGFEAVTQAIRTGSGKALSQFGIALDVTGDKATKMSTVLSELVTRFRDVDTAAQDNDERMQKASMTWQTFTQQIGGAIMQSKLVASALQTVSDTVTGWSDILFSQKSRVAEVRQELTLWEKNLEQLQKGGFWDKLFGEDPEFAEAKVKSLRRELNGLLADQAKKPNKPAPSLIVGETLPSPTVVKEKIKRIKKQEEDILEKLSKEDSEKESFRAMGKNLLSEFSKGKESPFAPSTETTQFKGFAKEIDIFKKHGMSESFIEFKLQAGEAREAWNLFSADLQAQTTGGLFQMASDGLYGIAGGIWSAADAAINGGASFGKAMLMMLKSSMMAIAAEATVNALKQLALGFGALFLNPPAAAAHFKSAALWGAAGVAAGVGGIAIGSAVASGSSSRAGGTDASRSSAPRSSGVRPSSSGGGKENNQQLNVQVFIGPKNDPASALWMRKQQLLDIGGLKAAA